MVSSSSLIIARVFESIKRVMTPKVKKNTKKEQNKSGAERPVSLWGASFQNVIKALLKTEPMLKEQNKQNKNQPKK